MFDCGKGLRFFGVLLSPKKENDRLKVFLQDAEGKRDLGKDDLD
jgi:hypothetical protein